MAHLLEKIHFMGLVRRFLCDLGNRNAHCFTEAEIKILFVSPFPTDPEKKALPKKFYFNFQLRFFFCKFHCTLRELSNVNSAIYIFK